MENVVRQFLKENKKRLSDYDGFCLELVDDVLHFLDDTVDAKVIYMDVPREGRLLASHAFSFWGGNWRYHAAVFIDGLVHDGLFKHPMPVNKYLRKMFPRNDVIEVSYYTPERVERWVRKEALRANPDLPRQTWG